MFELRLVRTRIRITRRVFKCFSPVRIVPMSTRDSVISHGRRQTDRRTPYGPPAKETAGTRAVLTLRPKRAVRLEKQTVSTGDDWRQTCLGGVIFFHSESVQFFRLVSLLKKIQPFVMIGFPSYTCIYTYITHNIYTHTGVPTHARMPYTYDEKIRDSKRSRVARARAR